eukprot:CAMPEP_0197590502 /NCGR_PEP_ID=MMETSP1326-20131121/11343_1 /TAXON_ID=1155430 /ORGANISM="Genus nov. species nov., Strain RCC2288" /LENGTH=75 /DNA_ID=CAMNT_0043155571 /DNA_START=55 /DNA_END=279 /DNA_ORIENTATION=+
MACLSTVALPMRTQPTFRGTVRKSLAVKTVQSAPAAVAFKRNTVTAFSDVNLVISGCTALSLGLGRLVFLPYQRA